MCAEKKYHRATHFNAVLEKEARTRYKINSFRCRRCVYSECAQFIRRA